MASIEAFKEFVKSKPRLVTYVKNGDMTWQKFYEMYDLYGEDNNIWNDYLTPKVEETAVTTASFAGMLDWLKNINLDSIQEGVNSLQRVIGVLGDLGQNSEKEVKEEYKPRPIYKHFED